MYLTNEEKEKLLLWLAGKMAKERKEKGLKLNYPEAVAYICYEVMEAVRAGCSYEEAIKSVETALRKEDVIEGVKDMIEDIQIELTFEDGTKLISVQRPIK